MIEYFKIESFSTNDGPGTRMVVFLCGCPYRCIYCHNPECWHKEGKEKISVENIIELYEKCSSYYKNGGITLSGGEPIMHIDFCVELAKVCFEKNISLCIDTSGYYSIRSYAKLIKYNVLFLVDIKHTDEDWHRKITGYYDVKELSLIEFLEKKKVKYWIRFVLIKDYTDQYANIVKIGEIISKAKYLERFEILPLHLLGARKYKFLEMQYKMSPKNVPTKSDIKAVKTVLNSF
jgi:pyruvate formate lyase activating enzyme